MVIDQLEGTITEEKLCKTLNNQLDKQFNEIKGLSEPARRKKNLIQSKVDEIAGDEDLKDIDEIKSLMDKASENTDPSEGEEETRRLIECFADVGYDVGGSNLGLDKLGMKDFVKDLLNTIMDGILSNAEQELYDLLNKLEEMLPLDKLDKMLGLARCLADCPQGGSKSELEIEEELNKNLISTSGEVDLDQFENGSSIKYRARELRNKKKETEDKILDKVKGMF